MEKRKEDMYKFKNSRNRVELNLENIIESTIKFLGLSMLIFLLMRFGIQVKKRPRRVRIMNWDKMPSVKTCPSKKKTRKFNTSLI